MVKTIRRKLNQMTLAALVISHIYKVSEKNYAKNVSQNVDKYEQLDSILV